MYVHTYYLVKIDKSTNDAQTQFRANGQEMPCVSTVSPSVCNISRPHVHSHLSRPLGWLRCNDPLNMAEETHPLQHGKNYLVHKTINTPKMSKTASRTTFLCFVHNGALVGVLSDPTHWTQY